MRSSPRVERIRVSTFTVPTDFPESDGTIEWNSTTMILVEADADGKTGLGYTYSHQCAVDPTLKPSGHSVGFRAYR